MQVVVKYEGRTEVINLALVQTLPYAILLGQDASHFWAMMERSSTNAAVEETSAATKDLGKVPALWEPRGDED